MKTIKPRTAAEIRQAFLDYFEEHSHTRVPSAPLVPVGDETLLFVNAGMVPFKDVFLGLEKRPYVRAASAQKCMRVSGKHNDLEEVGPSLRHHTFFEMLGNFSFGDYFKRNAIHYAWNCLTTVYGIAPERLVITVFHDDEEAYSVWLNEIGVPAERILRMGEKTNFWSMGDTGPCGPTSELHFDWGPEACTCGSLSCSVALDNDCGRWLEVWNLVFMQFDQHADGSRVLLPQPGVDTGMGFERLVSVLQGSQATYDTDLFQPIMRRVQELLGHDDAQMEAGIVSYRVIADHARAITFLIGDGVLPGNEGRNYILRLVLRRAARHGRLLGFREPFLAEVAEEVISLMSVAYPELRERAQFILHTIRHEEERFLRTLDIGLAMLEDLMERLRREDQAVLPGDQVFQLWDTYGFPLDLTRDLASEQGFSIDMTGYSTALEAQRTRARAAAQFGTGDEKVMTEYVDLLEKLPDGGVNHVYLVADEVETEVVALLVDGRQVPQAREGDQVEVLLTTTPFYLEAGGQVSDTGVIASRAMSTNRDVTSGALIVDDDSADAWEIQVADVRQPVPGVIVHVGSVTLGTVATGALALAKVNRERRQDVARNHTATHLLHRELRRVLGTHVHQAGSLVAPDRLRFDYTHPSAPERAELEAIERRVNEDIYADHPVRPHWTGYRDAVRGGAMALFGEKYGDEVRVVEIGESSSAISKELCGGNHVARTSDIGIFHIVGEGSVGSGARRIEAVTGRHAQELVQGQLALLDRVASILGVRRDEVDRKVQGLLVQASEQDREISRLRAELAHHEFESLLEQVVRVEGVQVLSAQVAALDINTMRQMTDWFRNKLRSGVVVLGAAIDAKPSFVAAVTDDLVSRGLHAGKLVKAVAERVGGSGGGRPSMAQAGGRDVAGLPAALDSVPALVAAQLAPDDVGAR